MCCIANALKRLGTEFFGVNPSLCCESVQSVYPESLDCAASASLLYLKGGAYMAVESPTGGPNECPSAFMELRLEKILFRDFLALPMGIFRPA